MALPASGAISFRDINVELGLSPTAQISLGSPNVRTLFGIGSGAIAMSAGYGKSNQFAFSITSNQTNADLRTLAINAGWNQSSALVATINGGVYILNRKLYLSKTNEAVPFSIEKDFYESRINELHIFGFEYDGYFIDIGIPEDYNKAQTDFKNFKYK